MANSSQPPRIDLIRSILTDGSKQIEGVMIDTETAASYVNVYDSLKPRFQANLEARPIASALDVVRKLSLLD